jgi:hypothetical protein
MRVNSSHSPSWPHMAARRLVQSMYAAPGHVAYRDIGHSQHLFWSAVVWLQDDIGWLCPPLDAGRYLIAYFTPASAEGDYAHSLAEDRKYKVQWSMGEYNPWENPREVRTIM